jgi:hypothetical protein
MKKMTTALQALALCAAASPALAAAGVSTHKVYNSGILVLVFLGFCALVVVSQLIPSIVLLVGMLKEAAQGMGKEKKAVTQAAGSQSFFDKQR